MDTRLKSLIADALESALEDVRDQGEDEMRDFADTYGFESWEQLWNVAYPHMLELRF